TGSVVAADTPRAGAAQSLARVGAAAWTAAEGGGMRYWVREVAGWALILISFFLFYVAYSLMRVNPIPRQLEATGAGIVRIIVFRGGLPLLRVAAGARICRQARDRLYPAPPSARPPARPTVQAPVARRVAP